jgi:pilus assembly protein Flp/PilA
MRTHRRARERGQGLVEYALILVLVAVVAIVILAVAGNSVRDIFCDVVINLGASGPSFQACASPRVTIAVQNVGGGNFAVEAIVKDDKGLGSNITSVRFYLDDIAGQNEHVYKYCMFGGDASCTPGPIASGSHTIRVVATDADGNTGESTITFTA